MKNFNNVRGVHFKVHFKGNGCVNFDGKDSQNGLYSKYKWTYGYKPSQSNYLYAKKTYRMFKDENGDDTMKFKYKVSSEALRHAMFEKEIPFQNPNISNIPYIFYNAIAMPEYIVRGYMFTESGGLALKKKSVLTITDAVEDSNIWRDKSSFEFHSRTGGKKINDKDAENSEDAPKDTTIYSIENVGNLSYVAEGFIDLTELQFISADPTYDRQGVNVDGGANEEIYLSALKNNFPTLSEPKINYYYMENTYTKDEWAERGIILDKESVNKMVKNTLKKITNIFISRRGAFFDFENMEIDVICDGGDDVFQPITITKETDVDELNFEYYQKYFLADDEKIIQRRNEMDEKIEAQKNKSKEEKKRKKEEAKKKKSIKDNDASDELISEEMPITNENLLD